MGGISMIIALIVILLLLLLGLSLGRAARQGDDQMKSALGNLGRIQDYSLGQPIDDVKDLQEFADEEYRALEVAGAPRMLINEKNYYRTDVSFAGFNWNTTIGVTEGKISKIALQNMSMDKDNINYMFKHTLHYLISKIGRCSKHRFLSTNYIWHACDGKVSFDKMTKIGQHSINLIITSNFIRGDTLRNN